MSNQRANRSTITKGEYKLGVWFIIHQGDKAKYFFSTPRQDRNNNQFVRRFRAMIDGGNWAGKVAHATFYHNGEPFLRYTDDNPTWHAPPKA